MNIRWMVLLMGLVVIVGSGVGLAAPAGPDAESLATYVDGGDVGFALKRFPDWTSIFYGSQAVPARVLRSIAAMAGVHIYNSHDDVLYATHKLLALHTKDGGTREISLPGRAEVVYDLFRQEAVARDTDRFRIDLAPLTTTLLYYGDEAALQQGFGQGGD